MAASASAAFSQGFLAHSSAHFCDKKFFYFKSLFAQSFRPASWQVRIRGDATCRRYLRVLARSEQLSEDDDDDDDNGPSKKDESNERDADSFRDRLEKIVGDDDAAFDGKDLATLIRNKYGRSYDVQLIKREFMGRQLLAMNVMWKYREQRSFPLTEEEYLLHLDDVANNLRCWGAVSYVRNSLAKTKERPRMGKAVSIFIDLDDSGGRANEWIYR